MKEHGIVGIQGIDTRALTRHLRDRRPGRRDLIGRRARRRPGGAPGRGPVWSGSIS
jgi:hypothetical protein